MLNATFIVTENKNLYDALVAEKDDLQTKRANVDIAQDDGKITITLTAEDFPAFRALETAIMRLLITFHKMKEIQKE